MSSLLSPAASVYYEKYEHVIQTVQFYSSKLIVRSRVNFTHALDTQCKNLKYKYHIFKSNFIIIIITRI